MYDCLSCVFASGWLVSWLVGWLAIFVCMSCHNMAKSNGTKVFDAESETDASDSASRSVWFVHATQTFSFLVDTSLGAILSSCSSSVTSLHVICCLWANAHSGCFEHIQLYLSFFLWKFVMRLVSEDNMYRASKCLLSSSLREMGKDSSFLEEKFRIYFAITYDMKITFISSSYCARIKCLNNYECFEIQLYGKSTHD